MPTKMSQGVVLTELPHGKEDQKCDERYERSRHHSVGRLRRQVRGVDVESTDLSVVQSGCLRRAVSDQGTGTEDGRFAD